ncbi:MAG: J domain-containing protein [Octadecabacter sp.]|nr:J domain-containing protein [Octadecabacter sp.]
MDRHLEALGLTPGRDYSPDEIKKAHRRAVKKHYPDVGGSDAAMTAVNLAYDALMERAKRQGG